MALLEVKNLNLWYGDKHTLKDISFSLQEREILCIVGESGSGKSSILYSILQILPKDAKVSGEIIFEGKNLINLSEKDMRNIRSSKIGIVFQEPSAYLDPLFTVGSQLSETAVAHQTLRNVKDYVIDKMNKAGIPLAEKRYYAYPHHLSGGLKQRVCIANAIMCNPKIVLADEPTTALDVSVQKRILSLFRQMKEDGTSVILVTHDFGVVAECADRVIVLKDGEILEEGDVFKIFDSPKHSYTKMLIKSAVDMV